MLSVENIQQYLIGAWRTMNGKVDGMRMLDLTADGFWNSFYAIVVGLPAMIVSWLGIALEIEQASDADSFSRVGMMARLAVVDLGAWLLPLVALAAVASWVGVADRFVHYVVASNWASAIIVWLMLPPSLLRITAPDLSGVSALLSLLIFLASLVLTWRMTNVAIGKGAAVATAIFVGMFVVSLVVLFALQGMLGISVPDQVPG